MADADLASERDFVYCELMTGTITPDEAEILLKLYDQVEWDVLLVH